jgi:hypothetical protein
MASAHPLRDVFSELAATDRAATQADAVLEAHGHADLPDGLVAEAVVSYADTAPVEVAEHLAPYVMAHSAVYPAADLAAGQPGGWLDVLVAAPEPLAADEAPDGPTPAQPPALDPDPADLDFGTGDLAAPAWAGSDGDAGADLDVPVQLDPLDEIVLPTTPAIELVPDVPDLDDEVDESIDD